MAVTMKCGQIDVGYEGWECDNLKGATFDTEAQLREYMNIQQRTPENVHKVDTRPFRDDVIAWIRKHEGHVWEEYIEAAGPEPGATDRFEYGCKLAVFCVRGSNEGIYLHVEAIRRDGSRKVQIIGKTLASTTKMDWCYGSAGRIAQALQA